MADQTEARKLADGELAVRIATSIGAFTREEWQSLSGTTRNDPSGYNPFLSYEFLTSLEESGCAVPRTGWHGQHLRLEDAGGAFIGAVPCYAKSHSQGEYVFDYGWADALERAGGRYYPKLQVSIPFTPVTGPRLLARTCEGGTQVKAALAAGLKVVTDRLGISSAHVTFARADDIAVLNDAGFLIRTDQQFHFFNNGYRSYADFLDTLASRKRKALKKERREALSAGITIDWLSGKDITEGAWDDFFAFYMDTGGRKWGRPYLNRKFFSLLAASAVGESCLLMLARRGRRAIGGSFHMVGGDCLFGRYWGAIEHQPFLHFEMCYYQAIDYAIASKLQRVEAGAQGEHKLARGYLPTKTYSVHHLVDPALRRAVAKFLERERASVDAACEMLAEHGPFRKPPPEQA